LMAGKSRGNESALDQWGSTIADLPAIRAKRFK
jgi:hypothetical protein